jgi:hypothetical protein
MGSVREDLQAAFADKKDRDAPGPRRPVVDYHRDKNGMFIQPAALTPKLAIQVDHNRMRASKKGQYADEFCGDTHTLDDEGDYPCGRCNQRQGNICLLVYDDDKEEDSSGNYPFLAINLLYGSCGLWERIDAGDPELRGPRIPASVANYGVRKGGSPGHVFGCHECWKKKPTLWKVVDGRVYWCGDWATTVQRNSCCTTNGAPTVGDKS